MAFSIFKQYANLKRYNSLPAEEKSIVFYSEDIASWVHFEGVVEALTKDKGQTVCYVTSAADDPMLISENKNIKAFYIGSGMVRTWFFQTLSAKLLIMTMPDLENYHIKRSRVAKVHYAYIFHAIVSTHMTYRKGAFDHFDSIFCVGPHHVEEIRATEKHYNLKPKNLVEHGYARLDNLVESNRNLPARTRNEKLKVLLAPTWGQSSILNLMGPQIVEILLNAGFELMVRPHPMTLIHDKGVVDALIKKFNSFENFSFESNVASSKSLEESDIMICDWSGSAVEYSFAFEKPVLYVDVPKKINNEEFESIDVLPLQVKLRSQIGDVVDRDRLADIPDRIRRLCENPGKASGDLATIRDQTVYNVGCSARVGAEKVLEILASL